MQCFVIQTYVIPYTHDELFGAKVIIFIEQFLTQN